MKKENTSKIDIQWLQIFWNNGEDKKVSLALLSTIWKWAVVFFEYLNDTMWSPISKAF